MDDEQAAKRSFSAGYYPMRVSLSVHLTTSRLRFAAMTPAPQPGLQVTPTATGVDIVTLLEGRLRTEIRFDLSPP